MRATAGAVEFVDVRRSLLALLLAGKPSLNVMVFRMPAALGDQLVLLQIFNVFFRQAGRTGRHLDAWAGEAVRHSQTIEKMVAPKSTVNVSPTATVNDEP